MIRNDREYQYTLERIRDFEAQCTAVKEQLSREGHGEEDVMAALAGTEAILDDLRFERDFYDRLRGEGVRVVPDYPPEERGKALIALRVATGKTQRQLAAALGVSEAQISRDEKNDYHGVTQERYARVLKALGVEEHVAPYVVVRQIAIELPMITREAASFSPDPNHDLVLKVSES
jgi:transcriptional regulator with XRE-family HTH domain